MIRIHAVGNLASFLENLKAPLLCRDKLLYHKVSLQASHYSFIIANDRN